MEWERVGTRMSMGIQINKDVSVVIPVYNSASTIERVLDSVLGQSAFERVLEIITVNDGSGDDSEDVIQAYVEKHPGVPIRYIKQGNQGASAARNTGIRMAEGEFIALLDSDDIWLPEKLNSQMKVFEDHPEVVFLGAGYKNKPFFRRGKHITGLFKATFRDIYISYFPVTPSVIFRRNAIEKVGYFDESQRYGEDINYYQRFLIHYNYYYLPQKLVEIGLDKKFFASNGLTSNQKGMYLGELKNVRELREGKHVSALFFYCASFYITLKYWRRVILKKLRGLRKG